MSFCSQYYISSLLNSNTYNSSFTPKDTVSGVVFSLFMQNSLRVFCFLCHEIKHIPSIKDQNFFPQLVGDNQTSSKAAVLLRMSMIQKLLLTSGKEWN